jgi:hypothetical protein
MLVGLGPPGRGHGTLEGCLAARSRLSLHDRQLASQGGRDPVMRCVGRCREADLPARDPPPTHPVRWDGHLAVTPVDDRGVRETPGQRRRRSPTRGEHRHDPTAARIQQPSHRRDGRIAAGDQGSVASRLEPFEPSVAHDRVRPRPGRARVLARHAHQPVTHRHRADQRALSRRCGHPDDLAAGWCAQQFLDRDAQHPGERHGGVHTREMALRLDRPHELATDARELRQTRLRQPLLHPQATHLVTKHTTPTRDR